MNKRVIALAAAMLTVAIAANAAPGASGAGTASSAGTIYEWVDEGGRLHASDSVPDKYKRVARRVDPNRTRVPVEEQTEALQEAAALKAKAASSPSRLEAASTPTTLGAAQAASLNGIPSPTDSPKCVAWRRQLQASQECFVYSSKANGHQRFRSCASEPDPEPDCAPARPR